MEECFVEILFRNERELYIFKEEISKSAVKTVNLMDGVELASGNKVRRMSIELENGSVWSFRVSTG